MCKKKKVMLFKEIKSGDIVWCMNRTTADVYDEKVVSVGAAYFGGSGISDRMIDFTVGDNDGENQNTRVFALPENAKIGYAQNWVVTTSRDSMIHEVENLKESSEKILARTSELKHLVSKCNDALLKLCPEKKREADFEKRLKTIEETCSKMEELLKELKS